MAKRIASKATESKAPKATRAAGSKSTKSVHRTKKAASASSQKSVSKNHVRGNSLVGEFKAAKTGRIIKSSPAKTRLGRRRIQTAVRNYVRRDSQAGKFVD